MTMTREQQQARMRRLKANCPFTGGRYIRHGLNLNFIEVSALIGKPGFEQLTKECMDYLIVLTPWGKCAEAAIIKDDHLEDARYRLARGLAPDKRAK